MFVRGTFVHTPKLKEVEILHDYLMVVDEEGYISQLAHADAQESITALEAQPSQAFLQIPNGSFIIPTFCDVHLHAPQFLYQGTGLDLPLMQWLDTYALKAESRMDQDSSLARRVYKRLAARLIENGTGAVLLFGTIKEETNLILAECMQSAGIRAFVGKLSMDIDITSPKSLTKTYIEASANASLETARSFINHCHGIVAHLPKSQRLVEPVLTPRFVPTCTDELLSGLGEISNTLGVKVQSHLAEAKDQVEWVRALRGIEDIDVFDKESQTSIIYNLNNLLTPRTVQAHCTFLTAPDFDRLVERGTSVAHCPLSNAYFSAKPFPLREALDQGVKVGLGTDVAGGYSLDIMNAMRQAVSNSRMREGQRQMEPSSAATDISIDWKESLFLATRGGALTLGLQGTFAVGAPFDAQEIHIYSARSGQGVGSLDYFDLESDTTGSINDSPPTNKLITRQHIEKWWCIGDTRNRGNVWVQGNIIRKA